MTIPATNVFVTPKTHFRKGALHMLCDQRCYRSEKENQLLHFVSKSKRCRHWLTFDPTFKISSSPWILTGTAISVAEILHFKVRNFHDALALVRPFLCARRSQELGVLAKNRSAFLLKMFVVLLLLFCAQIATTFGVVFGVVKCVCRTAQVAYTCAQLLMRRIEGTQRTRS